MAVEPAVRVSLTEQVARGIEELILKDQLREGDQLPATSDLAERFDVSRPVVREAIAELAARGIVKRRQGRETVVTAPGRVEFGGMLRFQVAFHQLQPTAVYEYRQAIEAAAARLAAERRTDEQLRALDAEVEVMATARADETLHDADVHFHQLVAEAAGNPLLSLALDAVEELVRGQRREAWNQWRGRHRGRPTIIRSHQSIVDAIRARDPETASDAMLSHLYEAQAAFEGVPTPMQ